MFSVSTIIWSLGLERFLVSHHLTRPSLPPVIISAAVLLAVQMTLYTGSVWLSVKEVELTGLVSALTSQQETDPL